MPSTEKDELRIFTPVGMLGYGFNEAIFWTTIRNGVDAIIVDSGSTDSGPSKLALGTTSCPPAAYTRELELFLTAVHVYKTPIIIASAGGDGTNAHVDLFVQLIEEIVQRRQFRSMNVVKIYAEIDKHLIHQKFSKGDIKPCGYAVPLLTASDIDDPPQIVAQMGLEPYLAAMKEHPDFDIIIGGRSYDPSPYAAFCVYHGFEDLGLAYHMGKIMECGGICTVPKSREVVAVVRRDSFGIIPCNPSARCTSVSVGAHTLYEKTRPDILKGPGGELQLAETTYEELSDGRTVRVRGARFVPDPPGSYTVKLEAARTAGYHSIFFGGFSDPILIAHSDIIVEMVKEHVASLISFDYDLKLTVYGKADSISMFPNSNTEITQPASLAICGESRASTQNQANQVVNAARVACMHTSYPGQKATSGNFGMVCAPFEIPMGPVCEFCVYHLMAVEDPISLFPIKFEMIVGSNNASREDIVPQELEVPKTGTNGKKSQHVGQELPPNFSLNPPPPQGYAYLGELASVIRSKNSGPYEITFDVMFASPSTYEMVKSSDVLSESTVATLYGIDTSDVIAALWWNPAMAFKATLKRPIVSGSFGETDTHGSCQHVKLMYLKVPVDP
ncbi:hypothetical protein BX600DRAFT_496218 [Xylariales sp. PMI_506]|nr:hypothetical protein BX600DRAFT_496218 [Xylariales sp. PMI_506]